MKLKDAIYYSAMFLRLDEVCRALETGEGNEETDKEINRLVRIANLVISETAREYLPLKTKEKITVGEGGMKYSALKKRCADVFSVSDGQGRTVPIKCYFDFFTLPKAGEYEITYSFVPDEMTLDGECDLGKLCERVLAYGICAEYSIISGEANDAVLWDGRYKDALAMLWGDKYEKRVAKRKWL